MRSISNRFNYCVLHKSHFDVVKCGKIKTEAHRSWIFRCIHVFLFLSFQVYLFFLSKSRIFFYISAVFKLRFRFNNKMYL